jgi:hypothetical protein
LALRVLFLQVLILKTTVFLDVTLCSLVDIYQHLEGTYSLNPQGKRAINAGKRDQ